MTTWDDFMTVHWHVLRLIVAVLVVFSGFASVKAQNSIDSPILSEKNRLELQIGYFSPRRGEFRDLYGSGLDFGAAFERRINRKFGWVVRGSFLKFGDENTGFDFRHYAVTPMATHTLSDWANPRLFVGAGPGLSWRRVSFEGFASGSESGPRPVRIKQDEYGAFILLMAGLEVNLAGRTSLGARVYFDRYVTGDPTVGDLGDTGGFHFVGVFGFGL